jgi:dTDP-4-amino-4,6-dideoxygalactose transaminase
MDAIMAVVAEYGLIVIEDASQAIGLKYRGRRIGTIGHAGALSFNQHKNIKSGEGGAVLTNDSRLHARASMYHDVGHYEREDRIDNEEPLFVGINCRMPELCAAVLRPQLKRLDAQLARRQLHRKIVLDELSSSSYAFTVNRHHDPLNAVGLAISFESPEEASVFGSAKGARRLIDTGRHVYTSWQSILAKRSAHPAMNPYAWAHRVIDYPLDSCPETLNILARSCTVELAPEIPTAAFRLLAHRMVHGRPSSASRAVAGATTGSLQLVGTGS